MTGMTADQSWNWAENGRNKPDIGTATSWSLKIKKLGMDGAYTLDQFVDIMKEI